MTRSPSHRPTAWLAAAALFTALPACQPAGDPDTDTTHQAQIAVFGTMVEITLRDVDRPVAERAFGAIGRDFQTMHHEWHPWNPGPLVEVNRALARGETAEVPESMVPLIEQSRELFRTSEGLFNPAIGQLLNLWGFQASQFLEGPPPPVRDIRAWVDSAPSMDQLHLHGRRLRSDNPAVQLDFGAVGKGYAVDHAIDRLRSIGIEHAIVNAGGDVRAIGQGPDRPWRIGVRHPQGEHDRVLATIELADGQAVFTSGNYQRFRRDENVQYAHILDPRTGWPVEGVTSVTVIHDNGTTADAAATALVVAGVEDWPRIAAGMGIERVMLVDDAGIVWMTPKMAESIEFETRPSNVRIRDPEA